MSRVDVSLRPGLTLFLNIQVLRLEDAAMDGGQRTLLERTFADASCLSISPHTSMHKHVHTIRAGKPPQ